MAKSKKQIDAGLKQFAELLVGHLMEDKREERERRIRESEAKAKKKGKK